MRCLLRRGTVQVILKDHGKETAQAEKRGRHTVAPFLAENGELCTISPLPPNTHVVVLALDSWSRPRKPTSPVCLDVECRGKSAAGMRGSMAATWNLPYMQCQLFALSRH